MVVEASGDSGYADGVSATRGDNFSSESDSGDPNEQTSKGIILKTSDDKQYLRISKEESKPRWGPTECVTSFAQPLLQSTETTPGGPSEALANKHGESSAKQQLASQYMPPIVPLPLPFNVSSPDHSSGSWAEESDDGGVLESDGTWAEECGGGGNLDVAASAHPPLLESDGTWAEESDESGGLDVAPSVQSPPLESDGTWAEESGDENRGPNVGSAELSQLISESEGSWAEETDEDCNLTSQDPGAFHGAVAGISIIQHVLNMEPQPPMQPEIAHLPVQESEEERKELSLLVHGHITSWNIK